MCSISCIWRLNKQPVSYDEIRAFNNVTAYRGPDGEGVFINANKNLALGHRRLAILDLSEAGKQPMFSADKKLVITFNGEIYNYIELKAELSTKGHRFITNTDTEVILAAYIEWGQACQLKLNGMWAFAIWNCEDSSLFLSRDRFGEKPLYYIYQKNKLFALASETVAFEYLPGFEKTFNPYNVDLAIRHPFYLESVGETIYKGIKKLLPGHSLIIRNNTLTIKKWWFSEEHLVQVPHSYNEQVEAFEELFKSSCELRLRSDVPVAVSLSGGLDSSTVYSTVQQVSREKETGRVPGWNHAFIACFPNTKMDERIYADEVVAFTNGIPHYVYPEQNDIAQRLFDDTRAEDFIYLSPPVVHRIYESMRASNVTVSIDGHGADELFFGYPHMVSELAISALEVERQTIFSTIAAMTETSYNQVTQQHNKALADQLLNSQRRVGNRIPEKIKRFYRTYMKRKSSGTGWLLHNPSYHDLTLVTPPGDAAFGISYRQLHFHLPTLLRNWDRASMKHGVEIRMPFLDWRLVSYVLSLPVGTKLSEGYNKRLLRDSLKGKLPESVRLRRNKIGINAPLEEWFNDRLAPFVLEAVNSRSFLASDIWNGPAIRSFVEGKRKTGQWTQKEAFKLWPYLNAWILMNRNG